MGGQIHATKGWKWYFVETRHATSLQSPNAVSVWLKAM
jgi:hypothetical protein